VVGASGMATGVVGSAVIPAPASSPPLGSKTSQASQAVPWDTPMSGLRGCQGVGQTVVGRLGSAPSHNDETLPGSMGPGGTSDRARLPPGR
jgi:hypothetical protein